MTLQRPATGRLAIVGLGPGARNLIPPLALQTLAESELVVGYRGYLEQIQDLLAGKEVHASELTQEVERARLAVSAASAGRRVCLVSSGDAGIYGMAGLALDLLARSTPANQMGQAASEAKGDGFPEVELVPGISALQAAASLLGAPLMHDFAVISLSDRLTPWEIITRRLSAAAAADFVVVLYNPASRQRTWQLAEAQRRLLNYRPAETPIGLARNAYRPEQRAWLTTLGRLHEQPVDMFTTVVIGNASTRIQAGFLITPRGYERLHQE